MPEFDEYHSMKASENQIYRDITATIEYNPDNFPGNIDPEATARRTAGTGPDTAPPAFLRRIDRIWRLADKAAGRIPPELLKKLDGGISITEKTKLHSASDPGRPLYILGEYCTSHHTGRHIMLYGGSIDRVYGRLPDDELIEQLDRILRHELTHHMESLSGTFDLELHDKNLIAEYEDELK